MRTFVAVNHVCPRPFARRMDSGAHKLLESATQRTLHAHAFSRSSTQASSVLTDLLSRYLALLTSTCTKYAQHAQRTNLNVRDAIGALDELGVNLDELKDYCATEGKELNRYALISARRVEDLHEFKCMSIPKHQFPRLISSSPTIRRFETRSRRRDFTPIYSLSLRPRRSIRI